MLQKEALARININKLLEDAGWRFFPKDGKPSNISLEPGTLLTQEGLDEADEVKIKKGYVDYLLLDEYNNPFVVVEAKKEDIHP